MLSNGSIGGYKRIIIKCGSTDLRCGIPSLTTQLSMFYGVEFEEGVLYVLCGRSRRKLKGLIRFQDGFMLVNLLLDPKKRLNWICDTDELREISEEQLQRILHGEDIK